MNAWTAPQLAKTKKTQKKTKKTTFYSKDKNPCVHALAPYAVQKASHIVYHSEILWLMHSDHKVVAGNFIRRKKEVDTE